MINDDIQKQDVGNNSTAYQANGNITVVNQYTLAEEQAYKICREIVENNIIKFSGDAIATAKQEFKEVADLYVEKITNQEEDVVEKIINRFKEPNMQYAIFEAQKGYTKYGNKEKAEKLVQLLIEKGKQEKGSVMDMLIDDAIEKLSKMTSNQLNILSYLNAITLNYPSNNLEHFHLNYINKSLQFYSLINQERLDSDIQYLMQLGCIRQFSIAQGSNKIINHIKENYGGLFAAGFTKQEFESEYGVGSDNIIIPCLTNRELYQISALNHKVLDNMYLNMNANQQQRNIINKFYERILPNERIREILLQIEPGMNELLDNNNTIHNYELMLLGRTIGIKNYETVLDEKINWDL